VVRVARLSGPEHPLEVLYFVEGPGGERVPAEATAATLNRLDLQRAAIVLGHRMQRPLAQREGLLSSHSISFFRFVTFFILFKFNFSFFSHDFKMYI